MALFPVIIWAYARLARREEAQMVERFGEAYRVYRQDVPMFLPRRGEWRRLMDAARSRSEPVA